MKPEEFKRWRSDHDATQESVARLFGVSRVTIQNWEQGKTRIPEAAESLWLRQAQRWRQRPEFGPVTLEYYVGPVNVLNATTVGKQEFPTNEAALRYARDLATRPELHFIGISDSSGEPIWFGEQVRSEIEVTIARERRNSEATNKSQGLAERLMEIGREFSSLPAGADPNFTAEDLYDEDGLPK